MNAREKGAKYEEIVEQKEQKLERCTKSNFDKYCNQERNEERMVE